MPDDANDTLNSEPPFIPALRFKWATNLYDSLMRNFVRDHRLRQLTVTTISPKPQENILDFGCGTGNLTMALVNADEDFTVSAYDIDPEVLAIAKDKVIKLPSKTAVSFHNLDLTDGTALPTEAIKSFDCVTSSLVFHHLTNIRKQRALAVIIKMLKPNGRLVLVDWGPGINIFLRTAFLFVRLLDGFQVTRDNAKGHLPSMIAEAGFANVRSRPILNTMLGTIWLHEAEVQTFKEK